MTETVTMIRTPMTTVAKWAAEYGISVDAIRTPSRIPHIQKARRRAMLDLRDNYRKANGSGLSLSEIGGLFGVGRDAVAHLKRRSKERDVDIASQHFVRARDDYENHLKGMFAVNRVYDVAREYGLNTVPSVILSLLAQRYPGTIDRRALIDQVIEACAIIDSSGLGGDMCDAGLRVQLNRIRKHFAETLGYPEPFVMFSMSRSSPLSSLALSHDIAGVMHHRFGWPVMYRAQAVGA